MLLLPNLLHTGAAPDAITSLLPMPPFPCPAIRQLVVKHPPQHEIIQYRYHRYHDRLVLGVQMPRPSLVLLQPAPTHRNTSPSSSPRRSRPLPHHWNKCPGVILFVPPPPLSSCRSSSSYPSTILPLSAPPPLLIVAPPLSSFLTTPTCSVPEAPWITPPQLHPTTVNGGDFRYRQHVRWGGWCQQTQSGPPQN